ncbi:MAG: hypothetical protein Q8K65_08205 [Alphaproteobacteria bacterium]|nr:hypothetical protein [Alphaproteobacteria bacterium]
MSEKKAEPASTTGFVIRVLLVVGLVLALIGAYIAFVILPKEWPEPPQGLSSEALPAYYATQRSVFASTNTTTTTATPAEMGLKPVSWRTMVHLENAAEARPDVVILATDMDDNLLDVDTFRAKIVLAGDENQELPGIGFVAEKPGRYVARRIALPENGDWEVRAEVRRGNQTMLVGQKIRPLLPLMPKQEPQEPAP